MIEGFSFVRLDISLLWSSGPDFDARVDPPVMDDVQNDLNVLGKEGWELVAIQDISLQDRRMFTVAYLKRQEASR